MLDEIKERLKVSADVTENGVTVFYSTEIYDKLQEEYKTFITGREDFLENIIIAYIYYYRFPFHTELSSFIWDNYVYISWFYSTLKFTLTALMPQIHSDEDLIDCLVVILRMWGHSENGPKVVLQYLHENSCDDLAHLALLLKSC